MSTVGIIMTPSKRLVEHRDVGFRDLRGQFNRQLCNFGGEILLRLYLGLTTPSFWNVWLDFYLLYSS